MDDPRRLQVIDLRSGQAQPLVRYWKPDYAIDRSWTADSAVEALRYIFEDSVAKQMRSDVPVGAYLSGGLDSSLVAKLAAPKDAFTVQFAEFKDTIN